MGLEQEALIRRNLWLGPRDGETRFDDFAEEWLAGVAPRLELNTVAKYRSFLDTQLLPQWKAWPLIAIFNGYVEIERWLSELHEDYAESSVASYFALFSTILNAAVRARMIPANPCNDVRVWIPIPAPDGVNLSGSSGTSTTPSAVASRSGRR
ncbi:phage integrase SAM-like domain-containing protein [Amycolatopsis sp. CA-128772]|uniref:phage integrase SAM-like domain-containing protein n=1 Tax=Amycolatopsis sp. CA-128772 TaxID=2073159 RepID=UPI001E44BA4F|nr:phage integrase SAM-like domain-containing protein [Amycolatopsis sp. CA-128772]